VHAAGVRERVVEVEEDAADHRRSVAVRPVVRSSGREGRERT
jgi:hypothetical protein